MTTKNLLPVIEIVEKIGAGIPAQRPTTPPANLDELFAMFTAIDDPLAARLREQLAIIRPDTGWAEHEFGPGDRVDGDQWVVDALDGAVQFIQGLPQWCVTVSLVRNGKPSLTVLYSPLLGQTYAAELGQGAWLNGKPIRPSAKTSLDAAVVATSQPPFIGEQPGASAAAGRTLPGVLDRVAAVRNLGPTSWQVADVAAVLPERGEASARDVGPVPGGRAAV
ncbi:inositol monophosphatase family protein, partial [Amycolatopsis sp. H20-H5]|uniref:inositol monophosphatase family protein n=1 Tax=Amycolatopsis sp. H20-H5 TaxID=3046309 RepID=UPI002DBD3AD3